MCTNCLLVSTTFITTSSRVLVFRTKQCNGIKTATCSIPKMKCCTSKCRWQHSFACTACVVTSLPTSIHCVGKNRRCQLNSIRQRMASPFGTWIVNSLPVESAEFASQHLAIYLACCVTHIAAPSALNTCTFTPPTNSAGYKSALKDMEFSISPSTSVECLSV